ncbi:MAG: response regulator [Phycisphaerales bacterium]|nr:response regulator [Phycisphaerales bacterium]
MSADRFTDLVRITNAQREALLDRLDYGNREGGGGSNRRGERRIDYRRDRIPIVVEHPAGGVVRLLVCARNLSGGGMSFIHGGFVHCESSCKVVLFRNDGSPVVLTGTVRSCRNLQGQLHEIGVRFDHRIDLAQFVASDDAVAAGGGARSASDLCGVVLAAGFSELDRRLFEHVVRTTSIKLHFVANAGEVASVIADGFVDIVLLDVGIGDEKGWAGVRAIRDSDFEGPLVAVSSRRDHDRLAAARAVGADEVVEKPLDQAGILDLLMQMHTRAGATICSGPLLSGLEDRPDTVELLQHYVEQAHAAGETLLKGLHSRDMESVRETCLAIKGSAAGYGFPALSTAAAAALERLDECASVAAAAPAIRRLQLMCTAVALRGESCPTPASGDDQSNAA